MIFDTFFVLFEADNKNLKKNAKETEQIVEKTHKELVKTDEATKRLSHSIGEMVSHATGAIAAILSVSAIEQGIHAATEYAHAIGLMSDQLGYNSEALDAWSGVVEKASGYAGAGYYFQYTVQNMDIALKDIAKTADGEAAKAFRKLGIHIKDSDGHARKFLDLLPEISRSFEKLSKSQSSALGYKIGLDFATIQALQKGSKEIDELIKREKELGLVTKHDTEVAEKFKNQQLDTNHAFRSLFVMLGTDILPSLEKVYKFFEGVAIYLRSHKNLITGTIIGISVAVTAYLIPSIYAAARAGTLLNGVFSKWFILIAVIAAIGVAIGYIYDDFMVFKSGGESVIGDLVAKFPEIGEAIEYISEAISWLWGLLKKLGVVSFDLLIGTLKFIAHMIVSIVKGFKAGYDLLKKIGNVTGITKAVNYVVNKIKNSDNEVENERKKLGYYNNPEEIKEIGDYEKSKNILDEAASKENINKNLPLPLVNNSLTNNASNVNKTTNVTTGPITVNTQASNPDDISKAFSNTLTGHISHAIDNFSDGVKA